MKKMLLAFPKTIQLVLGIIVICTCFSCSSKKSDPTPPASPFSGTWKVVKIQDDVTLRDISNDTDPPFLPCQIGSETIFPSDGTTFTFKTACTIIPSYTGDASFDKTTSTLLCKSTSVGAVWHGIVVFSADKSSFTLDEKTDNGYLYTFKKQ